MRLLSLVALIGIIVLFATQLNLAYRAVQKDRVPPVVECDTDMDCMIKNPDVEIY